MLMMVVKEVHITFQEKLNISHFTFYSVHNLSHNYIIHVIMGESQNHTSQQTILQKPDSHFMDNNYIIIMVDHSSQLFSRSHFMRKNSHFTCHTQITTPQISF